MASRHTPLGRIVLGGARLAGADADADLVLADVAGLAAWVADGDRAAVGEAHRVVEHLLQLLGARRREHAHAGHPGEQRHVVHTVVRSARRDR